MKLLFEELERRVDFPNATVVTLPELEEFIFSKKGAVLISVLAALAIIIGEFS